MAAWPFVWFYSCIGPLSVSMWLTNHAGANQVEPSTSSRTLFGSLKLIFTWTPQSADGHVVSAHLAEGARELFGVTYGISGLSMGTSGLGRRLSIVDACW